MKRKRLIIFYGVSLVMSVGLLYLCTTDRELRALRFFSMTCQRVARIIGQWGLDAERRYLTLLENNRTV